ncbi:MAG: HK97 gp10 family phage protein [Gemmatimonadaceae bacterium]|nr:HK97 gp10 family phage protein [Gemmatimonadaceae bacterium]
MTMTLKVRNVSAVIANLHAANGRIQAAARREVKQAGENMYELAYSACPVDTGFMRDNLSLEYTPKGLGFSVGWNEDDFLAAGLPFYPPYVVFGVEPGTDVNGRSYPGQAAQDPLTPAYNEASAQLLDGLRFAIRSAVR